MASLALAPRTARSFAAQVVGLVASISLAAATAACGSRDQPTSGSGPVNVSTDTPGDEGAGGSPISSMGGASSQGGVTSSGGASTTTGGASQAGGSAGAAGSSPKCSGASGAPSCTGCQAAQCCAERIACKNDPACKPCLGSSPPASCGADPKLQAFFACSFERCSALCDQGCGVLKYPGACGACFEASCCAQGQACSSTPGCVALAACLGACADATCFEACQQQHPEGVEAFSAVASCLSGPCQAPCYGP